MGHGHSRGEPFYAWGNSMPVKGESAEATKAALEQIAPAKEPVPRWVLLCAVVLACFSAAFAVMTVHMIVTGVDPTASQTVAVGSSPSSGASSEASPEMPSTGAIPTIEAPDGGPSDSAEAPAPVALADWTQEIASPPSALLHLPPELVALVASAELEARDPQDAAFSMNALAPIDPPSGGVVSRGDDEDEATARAIESSIVPAARRLGAPAASVVASIQSEDGLFDCTFSAAVLGAAFANVLRGSGASPQASCAAALSSPVVRDDEPVSDGGRQ